jgi:hypothetical protein
MRGEMPRPRLPSPSCLWSRRSLALNGLAHCLRPASDRSLLVCNRDSAASLMGRRPARTAARAVEVGGRPLWTGCKPSRCLSRACGYLNVL